MKTIATTKMSSKGQVVITESIRDDLGLEPGSQFVVVGENDVVILKSISPPSMKNFDDLIKKARKQARAAGMKKSDVKSAVKKGRRLIIMLSFTKRLCKGSWIVSLNTNWKPFLKGTSED